MANGTLVYIKLCSPHAKVPESAGQSNLWVSRFGLIHHGESPKKYARGNGCPLQRGTAYPISER